MKYYVYYSVETWAMSGHEPRLVAELDTLEEVNAFVTKKHDDPLNKRRYNIHHVVKGEKLSLDYELIERKHTTYEQVLKGVKDSASDHTDKS